MAQRVAILTALIAAIISVSFSSLPTRQPDISGAISVAILHDISVSLGAEIVYEVRSESDRGSVCLESELDLDYREIANELSNTILRIVPESSCSNETIEVEFGMFSAITNYRDAEGREAGHMLVNRVDCPTERKCIVEVKKRGGSDLLTVEREQGDWTVTARENLWVV